MAGRDPRARAALRAYREARGYSADRREQVWERIESSLDAGATEPSIEAASSVMRGSWVMVGVVTGLAIAAALVLALATGLGRATPSPTPSQAPHGAVVPSRPRSVPASPEVVPAAAPVSMDAPRPVEAPPPQPPFAFTSTPSVKPSSRARASSADSPRPDPAVDELRAELALVRRARHALRDGDPERALDVLDAHARTFPHGQMREDRLVLRIEALCAADKGPQARAEARLFLRAFPASAHVQRVRDACASP